MALPAAAFAMSSNGGVRFRPLMIVMIRFRAFAFSAWSLALAVGAEPPPAAAATPSHAVVFDAATARGVPPTVSIWSNGEASLDLREGADAVSGRVLLVRSGGKATAVTISGEFPIEESALEFTYFLPSNAPVWSLSAGMRVKEDGGALAQVRLPPVFGEWHAERIPLPRMMRGDTWRAGTARTAASLEIGILSENGPGQSFEMDFSGIRVATREGPRSPMAAPALLSGAGTFSRTFRIGGAPDRAWLMAFARPGFRARVNGRDVGVGAWCNAGDWPCREGDSPVAAEFSLDGILREGENTVEIDVADSPDAECAAALGWIENGAHRVVATGGDWLLDGTPAPAHPLAETAKPGFFDIYPVRPPRAWLPPAQRPDYAAVPEFRPASARLLAGPEEGRWGTARAHSGRWFLTTPSGHPFFFRGIQTVNCFRQNFGYSDWARRAYATERDWAADAVELAWRLGYNGVGVAASARSAFDEAARRGMLNLEYVGCADAGPFLLNARGERLVGVCDPFDPAFRERLRAKLAAVAPDLNARPAVFGICVGNEAHIEGNFAERSSSGYVYSEACGAEFVRWLAERYDGDVTLLDRAWFGGRTNEWFASFDEILARKPDPLGGTQPPLDDPEYVAAMAHLGRTASAAAGGAKGAMRDDFDAFAVRTVEAYADAVLSLMREFFPGKLIGSNRFLGGATEEMYRCWRGYDFIAVNTYPMMVRGDAVFTDRQMEALRLAHRATGRPVLLTEWGVQALDVRMQSPSAQLRTQAERGRGYGKALRQIVENLPFVAGVVDFGFQNLADSEGQGWGLVDNEGRPYRDYVEGVADAARWLDKCFQQPVDTQP